MNTGQVKKVVSLGLRLILILLYLHVIHSNYYRHTVDLCYLGAVKLCM